MKTKKWSEPKGKKTTPKFSRKTYIEIGNVIKELSKKKRMIEYRKWDKIFKADNPRYDSKRFKEHIGL